MVSEMSIEDKIKSEIDKIRPFLIGDGGDLEFVKFDDGIVYVKLIGACAGCTMVDYTLSDVVEEILVNEIPEVKKVERIQF